MGCWQTPAPAQVAAAPGGPGVRRRVAPTQCTNRGALQPQPLCSHGRQTTRHRETHRDPTTAPPQEGLPGTGGLPPALAERVSHFQVHRDPPAATPPAPGEGQRRADSRQGLTGTRAAACLGAARAQRQHGHRTGGSRPDTQGRDKVLGPSGEEQLTSQVTSRGVCRADAACPCLLPCWVGGGVPPRVSPSQGGLLSALALS